MPSYTTNIAATERFSARRHGRFFIVELLRPHRVFSTSDVNGGTTSDITHLLNYQSMEAWDEQQATSILSQSKADYHQQVAMEAGLPPEKTVAMGTSANMNNLSHVVKQFKNLRVDAFVTAGVSDNALRAGDPANWYETLTGTLQTDVTGTINTLVMINQPLTAGAQAKATMLMVEAKTAALNELAVPSTVSSHLATGTGTDQFIIATPAASLKDTLPPNKEGRALESASGHVKLGELIGAAVREATLEALKWQNRLADNDVADLLYAFKRFGLTEQGWQSHLQQTLSEQHWQRAKHNALAIRREPRLMAAAFAYAQLLDRLQYGNLPENLRGEILRDQAAQIAIAIAGKPEQWLHFWQELSLDISEEAKKTERFKPKTSKSEALRPEIRLLLDAIALGWAAKWQ